MTTELAAKPLPGGHPALDLVNTVAPREVLPDGSRPQERLTDPAALLAWARRAGLVDDAEAGAAARAWQLDPGAAAAALDGVRDLRDCLYLTLIDAAGLVPQPVGQAAAARQRLHGRWVAAMARSALRVDREASPADREARRGERAVPPADREAPPADREALRVDWEAPAARAPGRDAPRPLRLVVGLTPDAPDLQLQDRVAAAAMDLLLTVDYGRLRRCPPEDGGCGWIVLDQSRNGSRRWCQMADCGSAAKARRLTERRRARRGHHSDERSIATAEN
jgi:predicted RNA-binding Zn ribbon-like protein